MLSESQIVYRTEFLKSDFWQNLRLEVLARDKGACKICKFASHKNDAHHIFYPPGSWYESKPEMLETLCRDCHALIHLLTDPSGTSNLKHAREWFDLAVIKVVEMMHWRDQRIAKYKRRSELEGLKVRKKARSKAPALSDRIREERRKLKAEMKASSDKICRLCFSPEKVSIVDLSGGGLSQRNMTWNLCSDCWTQIDNSADKRSDGTRTFKELRPALDRLRSLRDLTLASSSDTSSIVL